MTVHTHLTLQSLKSFVAFADAIPPRTLGLEQRIRIGTGFHGKWYRSQKEHWLGWLVVQQNRDDAGKVSPAIVWSRLKCSPMMFWLAEVSAVDEALLEAAENAAAAASRENPKDGHPHGKLLRAVLPWETLEAAIAAAVDHYSAVEADVRAEAAYARLTTLRPGFAKQRSNFEAIRPHPLTPPAPFSPEDGKKTKGRRPEDTLTPPKPYD